MEKRNNKVLIVDDSEINRSLLADILSEQYEILEAENGMEASVILYKQGNEISLVLLDVVMPLMDGFELLKVMNKNGWIKSIPVIMISAETAPTYIEQAYDLGVSDYISRPFNEYVVRRRVSSTIMLAARQQELSNMVANQIYEKEKDNRLMIEILSNIVEFRNGESGLHVLHIHTLTDLLLKALLKKTDLYQYTQKDIRMICNASALHDIGKIAIPKAILNKPGRLTAEEFEIMKTHAQEGAELLHRIKLREEEPLIQTAYQICRWHHERYDGKGYPDGLKGDEIPISAQVVALADVYDALTSKRVYKDAFSHEKAMEMILNGECGAFNPLLLECLQDISDVLKKEFNAISLRQQSDMEILDCVEMMMHEGEMDISSRTLRLLEQERMKYQFYINMTDEIYFEYMQTPELLTLTSRGAEYLGVEELILNPKEHPFGNRIFNREDFEAFLEKIKNTSPDNAVVECVYLLSRNGEKRWNKVIARSMWTDGENPEYQGAIGKIIDIHDRVQKQPKIDGQTDSVLTGC